MFCKNCGNQYDSHLKFCPECGTVNPELQGPQSGTAPENNRQPVKKPLTSDQFIDLRDARGMEAKQRQTPPPAPAPKKKKGSKAMVATIIVVILALAAALAFLIFTRLNGQIDADAILSVYESDELFAAVDAFESAQTDEDKNAAVSMAVDYFEQAQQAGDISDYLYDTDENIIYFTCGNANCMFNLSPLDDNSFADATSTAAKQTDGSANGSALILSAFAKTDETHAAAYTDTAQTLEQKGLSVTAVYGADIDDFARQMQNRDLIFINAHGGSYMGNSLIFPNEDVTKKNLQENADYLLHGQAVLSGNIGSKEAGFGLLPAFFTDRYAAGDLQNAFVYNSACYGFSDSMQDAFESAGASVYIGYSAKAGIAYDSLFLKSLLPALEQQPAKDSFLTAKAYADENATDTSVISFAGQTDRVLLPTTTTTAANTTATRQTSTTATTRTTDAFLEVSGYVSSVELQQDGSLLAKVYIKNDAADPITISKVRILYILNGDGERIVPDEAVFNINSVKLQPNEDITVECVYSADQVRLNYRDNLSSKIEIS